MDPLLRLSRPFPIRLTRPRWNIPVVYRNDRVEEVYIGAPVFRDVPREWILPLADDTVVPDLEFNICLDIPTVNPCRIRCSSPLRLHEILYIVRAAVRRVTQRNAYVEQYLFPPAPLNSCRCVSGNNYMTSLLTHVRSHSVAAESKEDCSICYLPLNDAITLERCAHVFHFKCISSWITKGRGTKCPLCRTPFQVCPDCDGTGQIDNVHENTLVLIQSMMYDRIKKILMVQVSTMLTNLMYIPPVDGIHGAGDEDTDTDEEYLPPTPGSSAPAAE